MTNDTKNQILSLRNEEYGYKEIAKELNIVLSTVRYICSNSYDDEIKSTCFNCGIETISYPHKKTKKFCCDKCRWNYWNEKRREAKHHDES